MTIRRCTLCQQRPIEGLQNRLTEQPSGVAEPFLIPGASITSTAPALGINGVVTSGSNDTFSIPNLPGGTYTLTVTMNGFQQLKKMVSS